MHAEISSIGLIGAGALGLYYGGLLASSGRELRLLGRSDLEALRAKGITLRKIDASGGLIESVGMRPTVVTADAVELNGVDLLIISSKTTANTAVTAQLKAAVDSADMVLLTLQNGMGNVEWLRELFPSNPIVAGLCFVCANRVAPAVVENYLPGRIEFAAGQGTDTCTAEAVAAVFDAARIKASTAASLENALWRKLAWNIPFNGLSIATGCQTTDRLLASAEITARVGRLMREVQAAAAAHGCEIADSFLDGQVAVTRKMGAYRPSSLIDFQAGKAIELDAIWGIPQARAHAAGVTTPELDRLVQELHLACGMAAIPPKKR